MVAKKQTRKTKTKTASAKRTQVARKRKQASEYRKFLQCQNLNSKVRARIEKVGSPTFSLSPRKRQSSTRSPTNFSLGPAPRRRQPITSVTSSPTFDFVPKSFQDLKAQDFTSPGGSQANLDWSPEVTVKQEGGRYFPRPGSASRFADELKKKTSSWKDKVSSALRRTVNGRDARQSLQKRLSRRQ